MQVAIRELKSHFSKYLKKVQTGEEIVVTTHGKPIARLSQLENPEIEKNEAVSGKDILQNLSWIRDSEGGKPKGLSGKQRIKPTSGESLSDLLLEDRA